MLHRHRPSSQRLDQARTHLGQRYCRHSPPAPGHAAASKPDTHSTQRPRNGIPTNCRNAGTIAGDKGTVCPLPRELEACQVRLVSRKRNGWTTAKGHESCWCQCLGLMANLRALDRARRSQVVCAGRQLLGPGLCGWRSAFSNCGPIPGSLPKSAERHGSTRGCHERTYCNLAGLHSMRGATLSCNDPILRSGTGSHCGSRPRQITGASSRRLPLATESRRSEWSQVSVELCTKSS